MLFYDRKKYCCFSACLSICLGENGLNVRPKKKTTTIGQIKREPAHTQTHPSKINVRVVDKINEKRHLCHTENRIFITTTTTTATSNESSIVMLKKISNVSGKKKATVYYTHITHKRQSNFQTPTIGKWKVHRRLPVKHIPSPKQTKRITSTSCSLFIFIFLLGLQLMQTSSTYTYDSLRRIFFCCCWCCCCTIDVCLYCVCVYALVQTS